MTDSSRRPRFIALFVLCGALVQGPAFARESGEPQRFHVIYPGQRLTTIAKRYKVSVDALRRANGLGKNARLKPGEKLTIPGLDDPDGSRARTLYPPPHPSDDVTVPASTGAGPSERGDADRDDPEDGPHSHTVANGQRLESIAKRYKISLDALCAANGITRRAKLHAGQVLLIPRPGDPISKADADDAGGRRAYHGLPRFGLRKGYLDLFTYSSHYRGYVLDKKGKLTPDAQASVSRLFGATGSRPPTDPRLIRVLAKVSDRFGSRPIRIVSGYRTHSFFQDSRHKQSSAVDFSIPGIDNVVVRDFLRTLPDTGVGYYPNSSFVHLDVRGVATYWVDYAGPGQAPRKSNFRDQDREAEGDLQDPEVSDGERPGVTGAAPSDDSQAGSTSPFAPANVAPISPDLSGSHGVPPSGVFAPPNAVQNTPR